jgi:hypothetical protein
LQLFFTLVARITLKIQIRRLHVLLGIRIGPQDDATWKSEVCESSSCVEGSGRDTEGTILELWKRETVMGEGKRTK